MYLSKFRVELIDGFLLKLLCFLIILIPAFSFSQPIEDSKKSVWIEDAVLTMAKNFLCAKDSKYLNDEIKIVYRHKKSGSTVFYICTPVHNRGFVTISAIKSPSPVISYSLESFVNDFSLFATSHIADRICRKITQDSVNVMQNQDLYTTADNHVKTVLSKKTTTTTQVLPLIKTTWNQNYPFNKYCPVENANLWAGCVPVAIAQLMKYYQFPRKGTGFNQYNWNGKILSADFESTLYEWEKMPETIDSSTDSASINAIAELIYQVGVANETKYGKSGSGTQLSESAMFNHFRYSITRAGVENFSGIIDSVLKRKLTLRQPVYFEGTNEPGNDTGGHAFIIDGVDDLGMYHINWGWGGHFDGYYALDCLKPGTSDYTCDQLFSSIFRPDSSVFAPSNVIACQVGGSISITWEKPLEVNGVHHYRIYKNNTIFRDSIFVRALLDSNVIKGQSYQYGIIAVDSAGNQSGVTSSNTLSKWNDAIPTPFWPDANVNKIWTLNNWYISGEGFRVANRYNYRTEELLVSPPFQIANTSPLLIYTYSLKKKFPDDSLNNDTLFCEITSDDAAGFRPLIVHSENVIAGMQKIDLREYYGKSIVIRFRYVGSQTKNDEIPLIEFRGSELLYASISDFRILKGALTTNQQDRTRRFLPVIIGKTIFLKRSTDLNPVDVEMFSISGKMVFKGVLNTGNNYRINLPPALSSGYYVFQIKSQNSDVVTLKNILVNRY